VDIQEAISDGKEGPALPEMAREAFPLGGDFMAQPVRPPGTEKEGAEPHTPGSVSLIL
jgi:hypothetical protein